MSKTSDAAKHVEIARQFSLKGEFQKAISEYTKAIEIDDHPFTHVLRAVAYGVLLGTPMEYFDQKLQIAKDAMPDLDMCINILKKSGNLEGFPFHLEDFYFQRANAYVYLENPRKAIDDLDNALAIDQSNPAFWSFKGGIYLDQLYDPKKAQECFQKCISIEPLADAYLFLAWTYIDMENIEKAMMYIHIAAQMDIDVLDMERSHDLFKERQWKLIRSNYVPYANRHK